MNRLKQTHLVLAILSALSLTACGGSSSSKDMTNTDNNTSQNGGAGSDSSGNDSTGNDSNDSDSTGSDTSGSDSSSSSSSDSGSSSSSGSGSSTSNPTVLTDDQIIAASDVKSHITTPIRNKIKIATDGKLDVTASETLDASTSNVYDIGINGLKTGAALDDNDKFSQLGNKVLAVKDGDKTIYLRAPDATGWKYQTFGQVFEGTNSKGYASIGKPEDVSKASAYYTGVAMGTVDEKSEVAAQMSASIDISNHKLDLNIYNSQIASDNINNGYNSVKPAPQYDFTEKGIMWNSGANAFKKDGDDAVEARLYGPNAGEIGGTYQRGDLKLKGAFGGKKAAAPVQPVIPPATPRDGNGVPAIWFDGKFKALGSLNAKSETNLKAKWDSLLLTPPNTIVDNREKADTHQGSQVKTAQPFDLNGTGARSIEVTLENGFKVSIEYDTSINDNANYVENGEYIARSVHIFGKRASSTDNLDDYGDGRLNAAYVYGKVTPDENFGKIPAGKFQYLGNATFRKHAENAAIEKGTSSFDVEFAGHNAGWVKNGKIKVDSGEFNFADMKIKGTSFQTELFNNSGTFEYIQNKNGTSRDIPADEPQMRGRFYGESGNFIGGAFYDHNGVGTFFSSKGAAQP